MKVLICKIFLFILSALLAPIASAEQAFKDCPDCPEMVVVPSGGFTMGSSAQEQALANAAGVSTQVTAREKPQHYVTVPSFAAGRFAVTVGEYSTFTRASGYRTEAEQGDGCDMWTGNQWKRDAAYNWRNVGFTQGDNHPVVCISWNDAQAYIQWLSRISGKSYRLFSEAEREYAARGGRQTAFWWGDSITTSQANYNGNYSYNDSPKGQFAQATVPVNSFSANPYGLYNVHGNVWEWTQDCWHDNYVGAPTDGAAWTSGCTGNFRVLRGGSWVSMPAGLRSAKLDRGSPNGRGTSDGFRVARDWASGDAQAPTALKGNLGGVKGSDSAIEEAKKKCAELGFASGTEGLGKCVLQLTK